MTLANLVTMATQGNAGAEKALFHHFADRMMLVCRRYVKSIEDAEEVLLDGFYKFFKSLPSFTYQGEPALAGWLKKIMINECLQWLRKSNSFIIVSDAVAEDVALQEDVLDSLSAKEIFHLILQLPVGYRTVFNLHEVEGLTHDDIADMLGIAAGTSKSQLSKAKALLQKNFLQKEATYAQRKIK